MIIPLINKTLFNAGSPSLISTDVDEIERTTQTTNKIESILLLLRKISQPLKTSPYINPSPKTSISHSFSIPQNKQINMNKLFLSASLLLAASLLFSSSNAKYTSPPQSGHYQHNTHNNGGGIQHRQGGVYYEDPSFRTSLIDVMADGLMPWFSTRGAKSAFFCSWSHYQ
ncbi:unnamed protein product [Lepeophtheirus salmonis]|uniref:(salmon louse) hypothetical protein n=1 Tax=Lepeophtheirus salmonis TaxID=72036 RepID=A0A7R8CYL3_LEPSM|nr:unnamed protein product [Lepeophtheirus salmonis]CAF2970250.1 unnamed protein product [Lepeophtheirus salmonis]